MPCWESRVSRNLAAGVRNSVGFDWQPGTGDMWATTNGRDNLDPDHNNRPDDYLMWLPKGGKNFGYPYVCPSRPLPSPSS